MFKNKIITDLSGVPFALSTKWSEGADRKEKEPELDTRVINTDDVTKVSPEGKLIKKFDDLD